MVNPFVLQLLGVIVRQLLLMLFTSLGLAHVVQPVIDANLSEWNQLTMSVAGVLAVMGYAAWRAFRGRQKFLQACSEANITEHQIEQMVRSPEIATPPVTTPKTVIPA